MTRHPRIAPLIDEVATEKESTMKNEPAITVASITAVVVAAIALLVAFGVQVSDEQAAAIVGFVAVVGQLVAGYVTRGKVTPVE